MEISRYQESDASQWDELISQSPMSTFLHSRRYLSYHGDRFEDVSTVIRDGNGSLLAVFPAAVDPTNASSVVSHPGITYGGIVHNGSLRGGRMIDALGALGDHYRERGFETLIYKVVPSIYHVAPAADDTYALFRLGAVRYRCDLSCAIDLQHRLPMSERRKRSLRKARKYEVEVVEGSDFIESLWSVVEDNLKRKFTLRPVHSVQEIARLHSLFPDKIEFIVARLNSDVIAGIVLFMTTRVVHAQYTASSEAGQSVSALDVVLEHAVERAQERGMRYFDFGVSTENDGQLLNEGLYQYKSEYGAGGVVHEFHELNLRA
jgi:hypothetical protein